MLEVVAAGYRWQVELVLPGQVQGGEVVGLAGRPARLAAAGLAVVVDWTAEHSRSIRTAEPELVDGLFRFTDGREMFSIQPDLALLRWRLLA